MRDNICGNCDYCDKTRMRCIAKHEAVNSENTCCNYFSIKKEETYRRIMAAFDGGVK